MQWITKLAKSMMLLITGIIINSNASAYTISGILSFPDDSTHLDAFPIIKVESFDSADVLFNTAMIGLSFISGEKIQPYSLSVPDNPGGTYRVKYDCASFCISFVRFGHYAAGRTYIDPLLGDPLSGASDHADIDLELIEHPVMTGVIERSATSDLNQPLSVLILIDRLGSGGFPTGGGNNVTVQIPAGQISAPFVRSLSIPPPTVQGYRIRYVCENCVGTMETGFYTGTESSTQSADATFITFDEVRAPKTFTLIPGIEVKGQISRPAGSDNSEIVEPFIRVISQVPSLSITSNDLTVIPAGVDSVAHSTTIPLGIENYIVEVFCRTYSNCTGVFSVNYYNSSGTKLAFSDAESVPALSAPDIDIELLASIEMTGVLRRPANASTTEQIQPKVDIQPYDDNGDLIVIRNGFGITPEFLTIAAGENSTTFKLILPALDEGGYRLFYQCQSCPDIYETAYYNGSLYPDFSLLAAQLIPFDDTVANLNFSMLAEVALSGNLARPNGVNADQALIDVRLNVSVVDVNAVALISTQKMSYSIPANQASVPYSFSLPAHPDSRGNYNLNYACDGCIGIYKSGYFSTTNFVADALLEDPILLSGLGNSIDLNLIRSNRISGVFSRPTVPTFQYLSMRLVAEVLRADSSIFGAEEKTVNFINFAEQVNYQIDMPYVASGLYRLRYQCIEPIQFCAQIVKNAYFTQSGTVIAAADAELFSGLLDLQNANWEVLPDQDRDGIIDSVDNCPLSPNPDQLDLDDDGIGNPCDPDVDGDGLDYTQDLDDFNRFVCFDGDNDQCDDCSSGTFDNLKDGPDNDDDGLCDIGDPDDDNDLFPDIIDNCPLIANVDQLDSDMNGLGDACEDQSLCFPIHTQKGQAALVCL